MLLLQFIILQVIVFGAVIYFLKKILYSDTQSAVNRLDKTYQELLAKQKDLAAKIEQAEKDYKAKKDEAVQVSEKLKQTALDEIRQKEDAILKEAKAEADEMVKKARSSCDKIRRDIEKDVRMKSFDYIAQLLSTSLNAKILAVIHRELIADFLSKEKELDFSSVPAETEKMLIRTASPLSKEEKDKLVALVTKKLGRSLTVEEEEAKDVIAGVTLVFGTLVLDGSFSSAINDTSVKEKRSIELEA